VYKLGEIFTDSYNLSGREYMPWDNAPSMSLLMPESRRKYLWWKWGITIYRRHLPARCKPCAKPVSKNSSFTKQRCSGEQKGCLACGGWY